MSYSDNQYQHISAESMSLALDGLLGGAERLSFDEHLQTCSACRVDWTTWQDLARLFQEEPFVGPAPGFALRVNRHLSARRQKRERMLGSLVLVGGTLSVWSVLVAGVILAIAIWLVINPTARVQMLEMLAYAGQLLALAASNSLLLRDTLLRFLPMPVLLALLGACAAAIALFSARLAPQRHAQVVSATDHDLHDNHA